jgi:hypothetical protein
VEPTCPNQRRFGFKIYLINKTCFANQISFGNQ